MTPTEAFNKTKQQQSRPGYALVKFKPKDTTSNGLTRAVLTWLQLNGHYASRIQSQGQWNQRPGRFTKSTVRRGIGDIMAIIKGKTVIIEIKVGKDRMSEAQLQTQIDVEKSKGIYWLIRNFDDFISKYNQLI